MWRSYELKDLAPAYFIGDLLQAISAPQVQPVAIQDARARSLAWFPMLGGKELPARFELIQGETDPHPVPRGIE